MNAFVALRRGLRRNRGTRVLRMYLASWVARVRQAVPDPAAERNPGELARALLEEALGAEPIGLGIEIGAQVHRQGVAGDQPAWLDLVLPSW